MSEPSHAYYQRRIAALPRVHTEEEWLSLVVYNPSNLDRYSKWYSFCEEHLVATSYSTFAEIHSFSWRCDWFPNFAIFFIRLNQQQDLVPFYDWWNSEEELDGS